MQKIIIPEFAKFLLFDMDGTLVDTEPVGPATFLKQLLKYGVKPDESDYELFVKVWRRDGTDIKEDAYLATIIEKYKIDSTPEDFIKEFYEMYEAGIVKANPLPGVSDFLTKVRNNEKYNLAIVTASKSSQVRAVIDEHNWQEVFKVIVSEEDITKHKPDPEPFIVCMNKLGANPNETVIFEDSKNGTLAGKASGAYVVGLKAGNSKPQDLNSASVVINSFTELI